jgi:hypothetical protein
MQIQREFSVEVAQILQVIDEKVLKFLLPDKKVLKKQCPDISKQQLKNVLESLRRANPFQCIENPVKWQREQRKDRDLSC